MKPFLAHMDEAFAIYAPLLGAGTKPYVRQLAAESFAYLLRRMRDDQAPVVVGMLCAYADEHASTEVTEGLAYLLYESVKVRPFCDPVRCPTGAY